MENDSSVYRKWILRLIVLLAAALLVYALALDEDRELLNGIRRFVRELFRRL